MPLTPAITLNANLDSILGGNEGGYLRITLCGYGAQLPAVPGVGMIADAGIPQYIGPQVGSTALSTPLWGNDVIAPGNTFYEIAVLDANRDVIQTGIYQLGGSGPIDLTLADQILAPYGFALGSLAYQSCVSVTANTFTAPGPVVAVSYNGILLAYNDPTRLSYTVSGRTIMLNFSTETGDRIDAFCLV